MATNAYVGVSGTAKKIKNIYVGVNGVPKKVVKGYVGVNGVPKVFWTGGGSSLKSWDYWTTATGWITPSLNKLNPRIAYYAYVKTPSEFGGYPYNMAPCIISTDADAVVISGYYGPVQALGSVVDINGITWYYNGLRDRIYDTTPVGADFISNDIYDVYGNDYLAERERAVNDFLDCIYAVPFHEDYQYSTNYNLGVTDIRKTIRKALSTYLYFNMSSTNTAYRTISENVDTFISYLLNRITSEGTDNSLMRITIANSSGDMTIALYHGTNISQVTNATLTYSTSWSHYRAYEFQDGDGYSSAYAAFQETIKINSVGTISYSTTTPSYNTAQYRVGLLYYPFNNLPTLTNLGIDL